MCTCTSRRAWLNNSVSNAMRFDIITLINLKFLSLIFPVFADEYSVGECFKQGPAP